jgi:hypothetical protein
MWEIFINLTCVNRTPVYSEHNSWSQWGSVYTGLTVLAFLDSDLLYKGAL